MMDVVKRQGGWVEIAGAVGLYTVYEVVRGLGGDDLAVAQLNTDRIVEAEQRLGVFWEKAIQDVSLAIPGFEPALGVAYMALHFLGTAAFLAWVHRARPHGFPVVRTTIVVATGLALVGYLAFPAAPPRLAAGLGFRDAVSQGAGVNLSSDVLGALYNPVAAVPSLHFGYALIVGAGLFLLATTRWLRFAGAAYPAIMLYVVVATGNHFLLDAVAGGAVVVVAWAAASLLVRPSEGRLPCYA